MRKLIWLSVLLSVAAHADSIYLPNIPGYVTGTASGGHNGLDVNVNSGTLTATNPSVSATGAAVPAQATYMGANKAGNLVAPLIGQQTMANSFACVLPSDQSAIPVSESGTWNITNISGTISLPTGAATSANQSTANTTLSTISGQLPAALDGSGFLKVHEQGIASVSQSGNWDIRNVTGTVSLPTGAATAANQSTANTSLASIDTKTPALGQTTKSASSPVTLASDQGPINTLTTTGNVGSLNAVLAATTVGYSVIGVSVSGTWSGTLTFQGSIDGTNWNNVFAWANQASISNAQFVTSLNQASNGVNFISNTTGLAQFRVAMTAYTSGTANVTFVQSAGQGPTFGYVASRLYDGSGTAVSEGQGTMAQSLPVAIASNQTALPTKAAVNATAAFSQNSVTTTASTVSAPSNAVRVLIQGDNTNTDCVRYRFDGTAATSAIGMVLQPGQDSGQLDTGMAVSVASCSGTQKANVQYFAQ